MRVIIIIHSLYNIMYYSRFMARSGLTNNLGIPIVFRHFILSFGNLAYINYKT